MKTKIIRRAFGLLLCIIILAFSCINALCDVVYEHLYNSRGELMRWSDTTLASGSRTMIRVYWTNMNIPTTGTDTYGVTYSKLNSGISMWETGTSTKTVFVDAIEIPISSIPFTDNWMAHSIATTDYWLTVSGSSEGGNGNNLGMATVYGIANIFDANGNAPAQSTDDKIAYVYIFYSPTHVEDGSPSTGEDGQFISAAVMDWRAIITHEMGHGLGFGHCLNGSISIMRGDIYIATYPTLPSADRDALEEKYG